MNIFDFAVALLFHLGGFLTEFISRYGVWIYPLVFAILFCETGLFVPFLPGNTLILACAAFSAAGFLDIRVSILVCFFAAFLGGGVNYRMGRTVGRTLCHRKMSRFLKQGHMDKAKYFYEKYGGKAIVLSRFIPVLRQCTPFLAGIGNMTDQSFISYHLTGVTLWVGILSATGFFFGAVSAGSRRFTEWIPAVVSVSILPSLLFYLKSKLLTKNP